MTTPNLPLIESFRHEATGTWTHVVHAGSGSAAAIIDPLLDYDAASARTSTESADVVLDFVARERLRVEWILETHAHADHLSAAGYLRDNLGAPVAIGAGIVEVQAHFKRIFGLGDEVAADGSQFQRLFRDGETFLIGELPCRVMATPGHTADSVSYLIGDAAFIGDTLFAPETGTARADFPGGDAARLYRSIQALLDLPADTRLFLCHDYASDTHQPVPMSTVNDQASTNIHVGHAATEAEFVAIRTKRDAALAAPNLILPALQVNIRGGRLPDAEANGIAYLKLPLDTMGGRS